MPRRNRDPHRAAMRRLQRRRYLDRRRDQHEERPPTYQQLAGELVRAGLASPVILGPLRVGYHHAPGESAA